MHCNLQWTLITEKFLQLLYGRWLELTFKIHPNRKETENKIIWFPLRFINKIENTIEGEEVTFSSFVIRACEYALNHMNDDKSPKE